MAEHNIHKLMLKVRRWLRLDKLPKVVRVAVVAVAGGICFVAGLIMIFTPGPAIVFIPLGLFLLASEFKWAERWAQRMMNAFDRLRTKWHARKRRRAAQARP